MDLNNIYQKRVRVTIRSAYVLGEKRRLLVLSGEHIEWNKLKINIFLMETYHGTGCVCGHGKTIKLERHFIKHRLIRWCNYNSCSCDTTQWLSERERAMRWRSHLWSAVTVMTLALGYHEPSDWTVVRVEFVV